MSYNLRWYQSEAKYSIFDYFASGKTGNPIVALPTGTGKSVIIADFIREIFQYWPNQRVMMLTHVGKLIEQNAEKLLSLWANAPLGIFSAGLNRRDTQLPIIFGSVQSVAKEIKRHEDSALRPSLRHFGHRDLILIDECHLISDKDDSQYQYVIRKLLEINPFLKVIGLTATPYRMRNGLLTEGDNSIFSDFCYDLTGIEAFNRLLAEGYLAPLIPKQTKTQYNIEGVKIIGGDYNQKQLEAAVDKDELTYTAVSELIEKGYDRKHWLIFASGINHAEHIAAMLNSFGVTAAAAHSKLSGGENEKILKAYAAGEIRAIVNNDKYTTGFDFPGIDLIGMIRHTVSPGLWVQMLGRGTRPAEGKENCLVLDFAGNTKRLGPINDPKIPRKKGKQTGEIPIKICECGTYNHAAARLCVGCGKEFTFKSHIEQTASEEILIRQEEPPIIEFFNVDKAIYSLHNKKDGMGVPTLKVIYFCGLHSFAEWICFEHIGIPRRKAENWWQQRSQSAIPKTINEALSQTNYLRVPSRIRVWTNKKYPEILTYEY